MTAPLLIASVLVLAMLMALSLLRAVPARRTPTTPLEQAERILAARYARGQLSAREYERSLAVLRR